MFVLLVARGPTKGSDSIECGAYMERCQFGVGIIGKIRRAVEVFEAAAQLRAVGLQPLRRGQR